MGLSMVEFAKMRRLRVIPVTVMLAGAQILMAVMGLGQRRARAGFANPAAHPWEQLLIGWCAGAALITPIAIAVLASRQVDMEHQGGGWLLAGTSAVSPGSLCRAKWVATALIVGLVTLAVSLVVAVAGRAAGISVPFPVGRWLLYTLMLIVVNLVLLAGHVWLAARLENQLAGLGAGVLGAFIGGFSFLLPRWVAALLPWGYYGVITPVTFKDRNVVPISPGYGLLMLFALAGAALFVFVTSRFDRADH